MDSSRHFDVIVIGGGSAGLMAAGRAAERGRRVLMLEKNKQLGKKLSITGGDRCNITNAEADLKALLANYEKAEQFLYSAFTQFGVKETFSFFESRNLPLKVEERKRAFPKSEKASDVVKTLVDYIQRGKVKVRLSAEVLKIQVAKGKVKSVVVQDGEYTADSYIFATGGVSHPETGSTGDGFLWLSKLGHTVNKPTPTIVPLWVKDEWIKTMAGKTLNNAKIAFYLDDEKQFVAKGNILLTHFGLSGPVILNTAGKVADLLHVGAVKALIDLFPEHDTGQLNEILTKLFEQNKNKSLQNTLRSLLPPGTVSGLLSLLTEIDPVKKVHSITRNERRALVDTFKAVPVTIGGLMGYDRAVVADGGIPLDEIDMRTMRSRLAPNLFVVGDLLHIKRPSGGYSLQLCWTTGYIAGSCA